MKIISGKYRTATDTVTVDGITIQEMGPSELKDTWDDMFFYILAAIPGMGIITKNIPFDELRKFITSNKGKSVIGGVIDMARYITNIIQGEGTFWQGGVTFGDFFANLGVDTVIPGK